MTRSKLLAIAARMRAAVASRSFGWVDHTLPGDLNLVLSHNGDKWRLALRRERVFPSEQEAAICADVFGVPAGTEMQRRKWCDANAKTGRRVEWFIVELNWIEVTTDTSE